MIAEVIPFPLPVKRDPFKNELILGLSLDGYSEPDQSRIWVNGFVVKIGSVDNDRNLVRVVMGSF